MLTGAHVQQNLGTNIHLLGGILGTMSLLFVCSFKKWGGSLRLCIPAPDFLPGANALLLGIEADLGLLGPAGPKWTGRFERPAQPGVQ